MQANTNLFLMGGGEMGALTRAFDWSETSLGAPGQWPQSLRTAVSMLLTSPFPMFLWWGPELIQFYNDAYRPSLGNRGKHPAALGQRGADCWPEVWPTIRPGIEQILTTGEPIWSEDQLLPIYRNGKLEEVYWTSGYSPVRDDDGQIAGVLVVCQETTRKVEQSRESQQYLALALEAAELGAWSYHSTTRQIQWDKRCQQLFGFSQSAVSPEEIIRLVDPQDLIQLKQSLDNLTTPESKGNYDVTCRLEADGGGRWVRLMGRIAFTDTQKYRLTGVAQDVTEERRKEEALRQLEQRYQTAFNNASLGIVITSPSGEMLLINKAFSDITGYSVEELYQNTYQKLTHPDDLPQNQRLLDALARGEIPFFNLEKRYIRKDGTLIWVRFNVTRIVDQYGKTESLIGINQDITAEVAARRHQQQLSLLVENAPAYVAYSDLAGRLQYMNRYARQLHGLSPEEAQNRYVHELYPPEALLRLREETQTFLQDGQWSGPATVWNLKTEERIAIDAHSFVLKDAATQQPYALATLCRDLRPEQAAQQALQKSEARFRSLVEQAPVATCLFVGRDLCVEVANEVMIDLWGKDQRVIGKPLRQAVPELVGQPFLQILDEIFATGETYVARGMPCDLVKDGVLETYYFDFTYKPLRDPEGQIYAIMDMAVDVTEQVRSRRQVEASEAKLRSIIETAPAAMGLFVGRDLIVEFPNQSFIDIVGKGADIIGKPLREVMPELENQPFLQILDQVYTSGRMYQSFGTQVDIVQQGVMTHNYYNITYTPLLDEEGRVYAILDIAIDVTEAIKANQKLQEAQATLQGAIDLAQLGTWSIDAVTGKVEYSERLRNWFGYGDQVRLDDAFYPIIERDRKRIQAAILRAMNPDSGGLFEAEYTIVNPQLGQERILHAQGKAYFDAQGGPIRMIGTSQDITQQRQLQLTLEQLVEQRTHELATVNEELRATNEELVESNQLLIRSNNNLQTFAYIASHDLQEPLRKIRQFADLLKGQEAIRQGESMYYLERMQTAASHMSMLIKDLLVFSSISTQREQSAPVPLTEVMAEVLVTLELAIEESGAVVEVAPLPTVSGNASQLSHLFQNLLSNAIKFHRPGVAPRIRITAQTVTVEALPATIEPTQVVPAYYQIDVTDNGIGFEEKYLDRIFQVFQRLHGKGQFSGTGIGLAISEKVVVNHGGAITATSQPGEGATFTVYLPVLQSSAD